MSKVQRMLRHDKTPPPATPGPPLTASRPPESAAPDGDSPAPPSLDELVAETQRKEHRLQEGIARLIHAADSLRKQLAESETALQASREELERLRRDAQERETALEHRVRVLTEQLEAQRAQPPGAPFRQITRPPATEAEDSLLAQAKARG